MQAERRNTAEQKERADKAEERAEQAEAIIEKGLQLFVETCREVSLPREIVLGKLTEMYSEHSISKSGSSHGNCHFFAALSGKVDDHSWSQSHYEGLEQTAK